MADLDGGMGTGRFRKNCSVLEPTIISEVQLIGKF